MSSDRPPLSAAWRDRVRDPFVPEDVRRAVLACADEWESWLSEQADELLSPKQAAQESQWSESTIRKMLADGRLLNEGGHRSPKVRRRALRERAHGPRLAVVR